MADRRSVRASSRRKTPTVQIPTKPTSPPVARAPRGRALRSASRDLPDVAKPTKPTRRKARQMSAATATDESEGEKKPTRGSKRKPAKEAPKELATVEEIHVPSDTEEIPGTPQQSQPTDIVAFRSPGALSEMSGTTAITSFSMVEAEFLDVKYILKRMRKLCESAHEFLEHLAPENATFHDNLYNIQELQKPDADYTIDYRDLNDEFNINLRHYKSEEHDYIHVRALHRALFGHALDTEASKSGVNLILYLANLLIFAKRMIPSDRESKDVWDALRQLDNSFPSQFLPAIIETGPDPDGATVLRKETFELALELRTQLAISALERNTVSDPDDVLAEIFYRTDASQAIDGSFIRGWNVAELGKDDAPLPQDLCQKVEQRLIEMNNFLPSDAGSLERNEQIDMVELRNHFPWEPTILRLIDWVRMRHAELRIAIQSMGGPAAILRNVKQTMEDPHPVLVSIENVPATHASPRRKRSSFGANRRRSRKFDPNAPVDMRTIDALKAREQAQITEPEIVAEQQQDDPSTKKEVEMISDETREDVGNEDSGQVEVAVVEEEPAANASASESEQVQETDTSGPPQSSAALLQMAYDMKLQKENRPLPRSLFDRQANAQRVEFGDGFDESQPTPGPSNQRKEKQPAQSRSRKRRLVDDEDESEDNTFEAEDRRDKVQERREQAPVAKKVRIDPTSSGVPPSHQPVPHSTPNEQAPAHQVQAGEESVSEPEAPEMTEEPPLSTYQRQKTLAQQNRVYKPLSTERRAPRMWSNEEEEAFLVYMQETPAQYAGILKRDMDEGGVLQQRSQVDLKDKARSMAVNMIKSKTGLMPGFEGIIKPSSKIGKTLIEQGYDGWW